MEPKGSVNNPFSLSPGIMAVEQKHPKGIITKIRSMSRNSKGTESSSKSMKIYKNLSIDKKEFTTRSDTRASTASSSRSEKTDSLKTLPPSGLKGSKQKVVLTRAHGRDEVTSTRHQQIHSAKPKTPRPNKASHGQATKQKGDGSKNSATQTTQLAVKEGGANGHSVQKESKSVSQKSSKASSKDTPKHAAKKDCDKSKHESRRRAKPPQFPSEDDVNSTAKVLKSRGYLMEGKLGEGTYAKVRRAYSYHHNCRVAIKIVCRTRLNARFQQKFLPRELEIVKSIRHPHIIELLELFENKGCIFLIMELARHGDLLEYVQKKNALRDSEARTVFTQILSAVDYLHGRGIFHRDLKCENILLDWGPTGITAKITDFGFARGWSEAFKPCSTFCGSAAYASPEILQAIPYDPHWADIWSLGVVLYIMITGRMPFDDTNIKEALDDMLNNRLNFSRRRLICIEVQRLLRSILTYDPRQRPSTQEIKNSSWVRGRCTMTKPSPQISSNVGFT